MNLSLTYWKHHKKRAFSVMLAVTLSMAALVCTAFLARSASAATFETGYMDAGNYDIAIPKLTEAAAREFLADDAFSQACILYRGGMCRTENSESFVCGALSGADAVELYHYTPLEGRYPQASGEAAAQKSVIEALGVYPELGAQLTVKMYDFNGNFRKSGTYTIVGILNDKIDRDRGDDISIAEMTRGIKIGEYAFPVIFLSADDLSAKEACVLGIFGTDTDAAAYEQALTQNGVAYLDEPRIGMMAAFALLNVTEESESELSSNLSDANKDFNAKVLIPAFTLLVLIITFLSTYDVMATSMRERSRQFGLMRCLGMTCRVVFARMVWEAFILVAASLIIGFAAGALIYWLIVTVQINVLSMRAYYAFSVDRVVGAVSLNPYVYPAVAAFACAFAAVLLSAASHLFRSPLQIFTGKWDRESVKACKKFRSVMGMLSGRLHSGISQNITTAIIVTVVMCAGLFGYLYFSAQAHVHTRTSQSELDNANLNGLEYLAEKDFYPANCGTAQLNMHGEGVTPDFLEKLKNGGREIRYATEAKSTKTVYADNEENADVTEALAGCDITLGVQDFLYDLNAKSLKHQGYKDGELLFNIPTVGIGEAALEGLSKYLVEGQIHMDALASGEEVLILEADSGTQSPYHAGDLIPMTDVVIGDETLENLDFHNFNPDGYEPHFYYHFTNPDGTPQVSGAGTVMQWPGYGFGQRKDYTVRVGGRLVITDEALAKFYFSEPLAGNCGFNLICLESAFERWGLPDRNSTKVGAVPVDEEDAKAFDKLWFEIIGNSAGMTSVSTADIREKIRGVTATGMSTFYAMIIVLVALGLFGIVNTVNLRVRKQSQTFAMLRAAGMRNADLKKLIIRQNLRYPLIGAVFCWIPVAVFETVRQHIIISMESGLYSGSLIAENGKFIRPWYTYFSYNLDLLAEPVILASIITVLGMIVVMALASIIPIRWLGRQNIAETIRRDDFLGGKHERNCFIHKKN